MANLTKEVFEELKKPFEAKEIFWKKGKKLEHPARIQAIPYLHFKNVQNRLDNVLSPIGWKVEYEEVFSATRIIAVKCKLSLWDQEKNMWISKENAAPLETSQEIEILHIRAVYGDALVRAASMWGIGLYLYFYQPTFIEVDEFDNFKSKPSLPAEFLPKKKEDPQPSEVTADPVSQTEASPVAENTVKEAPSSEKEAQQQPNVVVEAPPQDSASVATSEAVETPSKEVRQEPSVEEREGHEYSYTLEEKAHAEELLKKVKAVGKSALISYVSGPKGKTRFSEQGLQKIIAEIKNSDEN